MVKPSRLRALAVVFASAASAAQINIDEWVLPYEGPKQIDASVGDTIVFQWNRGFHNVFINPTMSCDINGAIDVGVDPSGTSYTFVEDDAGKALFFSCNVGSGGHCRAGQSLTATVAPAAAEPTLSPVVESPVLDEFPDWDNVTSSNTTDLDEEEEEVLLQDGADESFEETSNFRTVDLSETTLEDAPDNEEVMVAGATVTRASVATVLALVLGVSWGSLA